MAALLGAVPLAIGHGDGAELRQPLGIAIVGGLVVSHGADTLYYAGSLSLHGTVGRLGHASVALPSPPTTRRLPSG